MKRTMVTTMMLLALTGIASAADKPAAAPAAAPAAETMAMMNCGEHLKAMIPLPAKFEELMTAVSENMSAHATAMSVSTDKNAKAEAHAFRKLAADHKAVAMQMKKIIRNMESAGKLAAAPHDMSKPDPKASQAMLNEAKLVREMAALMIKNAEETEKMVESMKGATAKK